MINQSILSSIFKRCHGAIIKFKRAQKGTVAVNFALVSAPLVALAGGTLDYGYANLKKTELQAKLDAAVIAAAMQLQNSPTKEEQAAAKTTAENMFKSWALLQGGALTIDGVTVASADATSTNQTSGAAAATTAPSLVSSTTATFAYVDDGGLRINGQASMTVQTSVLGLVGINTLTVNAKSQATRALGAPYVPTRTTFNAVYARGDYWKRISVLIRNAPNSLDTEVRLARYEYFPHTNGPNHVTASYNKSGLRVDNGRLTKMELTDPFTIPADFGYLYLKMEVRENGCPPGKAMSANKANVTDPVTGLTYYGYQCTKADDSPTLTYSTDQANQAQNLFVNGVSLPPNRATTVSQLFPVCPTSGSATINHAWEDTAWDGTGSMPHTWKSTSGAVGGFPTGNANDINLGQDFFFQITVKDCVKNNNPAIRGVASARITQ